MLLPGVSLNRGGICSCPL